MDKCVIERCKDVCYTKNILAFYNLRTQLNLDLFFYNFSFTGSHFLWEKKEKIQNTKLYYRLSYRPCQIKSQTILVISISIIRTIYICMFQWIDDRSNLRLNIETHCTSAHSCDCEWSFFSQDLCVKYVWSQNNKLYIWKGLGLRNSNLAFNSWSCVGFYINETFLEHTFFSNSRDWLPITKLKNGNLAFSRTEIVLAVLANGIQHSEIHIGSCTEIRDHFSCNISANVNISWRKCVIFWWKVLDNLQ